MRKSLLLLILFIFSFSFSSISCKKKEDPVLKLPHKISAFNKVKSLSPFDSTLVSSFFIKHPKLQKYQEETTELYRKRNYQYIWFDSKGILEVSHLLYNKLNNMEDEGIKAAIPYKENLDALFQNATENQSANVNDELLITSLYFFYTHKVLKGIDDKKIAELGWYLPRKKQSYVNYLDSIITNPSLIDKNEKEVLNEYYSLKEVLHKYRKIQKNNSWNPIELDSSRTSLKPGDSSQTIAQIRQRLFILEDIAADSKSTLYDDTLSVGILKYQKRNGIKENQTITQKTIASLNVPIENRIKTIMVNMERCRWIDADVAKAPELIVVNIPSYRLTFFKEGKPVLTSNVVVGKDMNKTVIFSADMRYIVFSPYWNVPKSIIAKEIKPGIAKNPNYLSKHNMERYNGGIRQKPGPKNSLGLVKFLFPNNNSIYLHDTPSKNLFDEEKRAFSHGCIRVAKPVELANEILKNDKNWTPEKIDAAMHKGKESWYTLKNKIPVYIGYFTAWVDNEGVIHFYDDVYQRDDRLATMLFEE
ncbi:murein L,D-transpeptidase YcbB/YkuD [Flavobacterium sp. 103]|uniref:L,D-transpeptidase family protein n=1 Tax=Flavobacterium sp. 103 TaxID=2135624 RepID=UPI000D5E6F06|nr:L,D-transpeptidase family protein [Flavobacterium sp. 103]PVX46189.1 murein L,D-transpeptidase YcbB/YkuD [Flavobacterium sp. 103]